MAKERDVLLDSIHREILGTGQESHLSDHNTGKPDTKTLHLEQGSSRSPAVAEIPQRAERGQQDYLSAGENSFHRDTQRAQCA